MCLSRTWVMVFVTIVCIIPLGLLKNIESLSAICTTSIIFYFCLVLKVSQSDSIRQRQTNFEARKMISSFAFDCRWLPNRSRTCHAAIGMILYHCGDQPASSSVCPFLWWPLHVKREYYERLTKLNARCINWHWILQQHFRSVRLVAESNASAYEWHCEIGHGPLHRRLCTGWLFRLCCIQQSDFLRQRNVVFLNIAG